MKISNEHKAALVGHEHREEILAILAEDPDYSSERRNGRVVGQQADTHGETEGAPEAETHIFDVSTLAHWQYGFDVEGFLRHDARKKGQRAIQGLAFAYRPGGKGPFAKLTLSVRNKVKEAYAKQVAQENV